MVNLWGVINGLFNVRNAYIDNIYNLKEYDRLSNSSESWYCKPCMLSSFTDSYFEISINNNEESANCDYLPCHSITTSGLTDVNKDAHDVFENLTKARRCNPLELDVWVFKHK